MSGSSASAELLAQRASGLPAVLREVLASFEATMPGGSVITTGVGLSEGPARFLVAWLAEQGRAARYLPLSEFAAPAMRARADTLVVFSQGLSPNARFALAHLGAFRHSLLVTSVVPDEHAPHASAPWTAAYARARGATIVCLPPREEGQLLLRVVGSAVATLAAALLCTPPNRRAELGAVPEAYARTLAHPPDASLLRAGELAPMALVAAGGYVDACQGLRCKLLEGLLIPEPPVWDLLQIPHGPLQSFYDRRFTLLALERAREPHEQPLYRQLERLLVPERHALVRLSSNLPGLLASFEHDAQLNALLIAAVRALGRDLGHWPGQGCDGPLYDLCPRSLRSLRRS